MRRTMYILLGAMFFLLPALSAFEYVPGEFLVKVKPGSTMYDNAIGTVIDLKTEREWLQSGASSWDKLIQKKGIDEISGMDRWFLVHTASGWSVPEAIDQFLQRPEVEFAEPNYLQYPREIPNDPNYEFQWHWPYIEAESAWDMGHGSSSVVISIIDSGTDLDHEDLAPVLWANDDPVNGVDDDGNGYVDDYVGWDFYSSDNDPDNVQADNDHGTHVSGIAGAATNNSIGVAGASWGCSLMICKVFPDGGGGAPINAVVQAITYSTDNDASVINMSLGGPGAQAEQDACWYAYSNGVVVVAAAGNDGSGAPHYPAAYPGVLSIGNTTKLDIRNGSSNYGDWVDLCAPGSKIYSTIPNDGYEGQFWDGTSMASPVVAGFAGLLRSVDPGLTPDEVEARIEGGCDNIDFMNPGFAGSLGAGRINFYNSMTTEPRIKAYQHIVNDGSGNNNNEADNGETVELALSLMNHSWVDATNVQVTLQALNPGVTIVNGSASYGAVASKEVKLPGANFTLEITTGSVTDLEIGVNVTADGGYSNSDSFMLSVNNPMPNMPGFPYASSADFNSSPKAVDMDDDGDLEIVVAGNNGLVYMLNHDGSSVPGWPVYTGTLAADDAVHVLAAPAIGDIDMDGVLDVVVADYLYERHYTSETNYLERWMGRVYVFNLDGSIQDGFPLQMLVDFQTPPATVGSEIKAAPVIADVAGDTHPEIIVGSYDNRLYVIRYNGAFMSGWPKDLGTDIFAAVAAGDLDGDGVNELVAATKSDTEPYDSGAIYLFDGAGNVKPGFPKNFNTQIYSAPILVDLDGDMDKEIVFGYGDFYEELPDHGIYALHHDGSDVAGWPVPTLTTVYGAPAAGDIDEDGLVEIVVGDFAGRVFAYNHDGSIVPGFPAIIAPGDKISSSAAIADVDGVGGPEILIGCADTNLHVLHNDGTAMLSTPLAVDGDAFSSPCAADLDNDGQMELIICAKSIFAFTMTDNYQAAKQFWPTYHGDNCNSGDYKIASLAPGVTISLNKTMFTAGDLFDLKAIAVNGDAAALNNTDLFVILDVYGQFWFHPGWNQTVDWQDIASLVPGATTYDILSFTWPTVSGTVTGLRFWGGLLTESAQLYGDVDFAEFGYQ